MAGLHWSVSGKRVHLRCYCQGGQQKTAGTYPVSVLVNLLLRVEHPVEALALARRFLVSAHDRQSSSPSIIELCRKVGDYHTLAEVAHEQGDPVHFLAGLLATSR
jgi:hypothetical protein